ncbi:SGNH/GDSL hydrolase family protein [Actinoplanes sp. LDG1-06]|uniref:SGNH/GDSL hydrolase family protein n=1 Tax=Paractinoplanes ovalisporus TaxID=2810368 RepID=A0ABS2AKM8_9ACTN|nr:SGNH/GDSL hydrolase family protein [Actinoplanes ovalisporus]MBM2619806.1 SGNH/GDSL hydrolase family protein [Actinoplanes ovalisporus]
MRRRTLLGAGAAVVPASLPLRPSDLSLRPSEKRWIHTWTAMPQLTEPSNMPPAPFTGPSSVLVDTTLRQTVHVTVGGSRVRVRLSNAFGGAALPITAAAVALPLDGRAGVSSVRPGSSRPLTFGGRPGTTVPVGAQAVSDPVALPVGRGANLTITLYLAGGQASLDLTSHPGSRTTSYLIGGDHHTALDLPGAVGVAHWYLISGVEVEADVPAMAIVGDSLTDGRGSTTDGNDRWPDQVTGARVAVLNQAAGGNRVLNDGLGPNVLARLDRDVLATSGVDRMLIFEGVNDIGTAPATVAGQKAVREELIYAYEQIVTRAHAVDIRVYGATITPFGGNTGYDDPDGYREDTRTAVNSAIRHNGLFDDVVDFDAAVRDPGSPRMLSQAFDTGDHLHLNPAGYRAMAGVVPRRWLR